MRFVMPIALVVGYLTVVSGGAAHAVNLPTLTIGDVTVVEGDAGSAVIKVPVDLSAPSTAKVTVAYTIRGGTATAGADFSAKTGHLTFLPGPTVSKVISVTVYGDLTLGESDETVLVDLSAPVNADLANSEGVVTITDDDSDTKTGLQVSIGDFDVEEADAGTHYAYLPVTLSQPAPTTIKVYYTVTCSPAVNGMDFVTKNKGTLTFLRGQQAKLLKFRIDADLTIELAKSALETITVGSGPAVLNDATGEATIVDDDGAIPDDGLPVLPVGGLERQSVSSDGFGAASPAPGVCGSSAEGSFGPTVSADGRYVAFVSDGVGLVPDDENSGWDVFVRDRLTGTTERVSVASDGSETSPVAPWGALYPASFPAANNAMISRDGRYVTFWEARTLGGYQGGQFFIHDRQTHTTQPLLIDSAGNPVSASGIGIQLSADNRYAVFYSCGDATGLLVPSDLDPPSDPINNNHYNCDAFLFDRTTGTYTLVTQPPGGGPGDGHAAVISANGRYVAFSAGTTSYVPGDTNGCPDLYVRDMVTGAFDRINVTTAGVQSPVDLNGSCDGEVNARPASLSDDGRYVAFVSDSWTLAGFSTPPANGVMSTHVYVRDRVAHTTTPPLDGPGFRTTTWPSISGNGAYVGYICYCRGDVDLEYSVTEVATGDTIRAGELPDGTQGDDVDDSFMVSTQSFSADGRYVVFASLASNLIDFDDNDAADVFVKRVF